jgi:putative ABC transport system permease protein
MLGYYFRLAWLSLKKTPVLSALMALAIAVGIASCLTILTMYSVISSNPMAHKNDQIAAIQLNTWGDEDGYYENNGIPVSLTYKDAVAIYESGVPEQVVLTINSVVKVDSLSNDIPPSSEETRMVTRDFFAMFDVPFQYGGTWSEQDDRNGERVVVMSERLSEKYFPNSNPVGQVISFGGIDHTIVGVVPDTWNQTPSVYDLYGNPFRPAPKLYIPFFGNKHREYPVWGNMSGWRDEDIRSREDFLSSEVVWIYAWAGFSSPDNRAEFDSFLKRYVATQHQLGRFPLFQDYHLQSPEEWLKIYTVVQEDDKLLLWFSFAFLIVCLVNSVVLLLAKFSRNAPEAGVRRALGANKKSIFLQHMTESLMISCMGAILGLALSAIGLSAVRTMYHNFDAVAAVNAYTFVYAVILALVAGIFSGFLPALNISRTEPARYLKAD